jgi:Spy/CpxP family protein refolding chaperone
MRKPIAPLAVSALFLVGVLVGVVATHAFYAWQLRRPGGLAALGVHVLGNRLERQLDLSDEQERQVDAILADTRRELMQLRHDTVPRVLAIRDRSFARIDALLEPEQRARLKRFRARHERRVERLVGDW